MVAMRGESSSSPSAMRDRLGAGAQRYPPSAPASIPRATSAILRPKLDLGARARPVEFLMRLWKTSVNWSALCVVLISGVAMGACQSEGAPEASSDGGNVSDVADGERSSDVEDAGMAGDTASLAEASTFCRPPRDRDAASSCADAGISAANYDMSCQADSDCVLISEGEYCDACSLACGPFGAISRSALPQFEADAKKTPGGSLPGAESCAPCCGPNYRACCQGEHCEPGLKCGASLDGSAD